MTNIWCLVALVSVVQPCCLPRQIQFDMTAKGYEEFFGQKFYYTDHRTFYYDEDRNCTFLRSRSEAGDVQLSILTNYSSGTEYTVGDNCFMRSLSSTFEKKCLSDNAVFQREIIMRNDTVISRVHVYKANISENGRAFEREYGVVPEGDTCYFLWQKDTDRPRRLEDMEYSPETITFTNIQKQILDNSVFEVPEKCADAEII
ncbi:uncharacterized protein LOC133205398 [Saccostrea echinata]|uniref:uncharacterized protein LOC133205398 n=1 Tax=Saccostrea echinata TaxID=191078 RepID=UPI002A7FEA58|nr:uncharacterized protein LOC133205398 [Saccostrea echinata]